MLPSAYLEDANWADAFEVDVAEPDWTALEAAWATFAARPPTWMLVLMKLRNRIVGLLGLKSASPSGHRETVGAFPMIRGDEHCVVLGFDDWHLDFRIVVETNPSSAGTRVHLATLVARKHWFGYLYIFLITPFHRLIVKRLMRNLVKGA